MFIVILSTVVAVVVVLACALLIFIRTGTHKTPKRVYPCPGDDINQVLNEWGTPVAEELDMKEEDSCIYHFEKPNKDFLLVQFQISTGKVTCVEGISCTRTNTCRNNR